MEGVTAISPAAPVASLARVSRRRRAAAACFDAATLLVALCVAGVAATGWLLARTEAGRLDVREADARIAAALVLATPPAWLAWFAPAAVRGVTPGQRRAALEVDGTGLARALRLALHPLALPLWGWLALALLAAGLPLVSIVPALAAAFVLLLGAGSAVLWAASPGSRALHDRLARTRLVPAATSSGGTA
jgi:hypothetical protein